MKYCHSAILGTIWTESSSRVAWQHRGLAVLSQSWRPSQAAPCTGMPRWPCVSLLERQTPLSILRGEVCARLAPSREHPRIAFTGHSPPVKELGALLSWFGTRIARGHLLRRAAWALAAVGTLVFALPAAIAYEFVKAIDRRGLLSARGHWAIAITVVFIGSVLVGAANPRATDSSSVSGPSPIPESVAADPTVPPATVTQSPARTALKVPEVADGVGLSVRAKTGEDYCGCQTLPGDASSWFVSFLRNLDMRPDEVEVRQVDAVVGDEFGFLDPAIVLVDVPGRAADELVQALYEARAGGLARESLRLGGMDVVFVDAAEGTDEYYAAVGSTVIWIATSQRSFAEAFVAGANPDNPVVTAPPATTTAMDSLPIVLKGEASADGEPTTELIELGGGDYSLRWTVRSPFDPALRSCGVTIALYDPSGSYAGGVEQTSTIVERPTSGQFDFRDLAPGRYQLFAYVGCPWETTVDRP